MGNLGQPIHFKQNVSKEKECKTDIELISAKANVIPHSYSKRDIVSCVQLGQSSFISLTKNHGIAHI